MVFNILYWIHMVAVFFTALYGVHRLVLLKRWWALRRKGAPSPLKICSFPFVTVQLPLFNEEAVAERLLKAVGALDWPLDRLEIQVLDDSTDATRQAVDKGVLALKKVGKEVSVLRRKTRTGFKAGALARGLSVARGEFVAIFDADFVPPENFLKEILPKFDASNVGMVQGRWGFLNAGDSVVTGVQALALSSHFDIEHATRHAGGCFFNFNGTAGVWRKEAIFDAGGWSADTLTEDLDLSYRAQLAGWKMEYHGGCVAPSELPPTLTDFIAQQERWNRGSMQTAVKLLPRVLGLPFSLKVKAEAAFHLLAGIGWLAGALATLTLWPALEAVGRPQWSWISGVAVLTGSCGALIFYYTVYALTEQRSRGLVWCIPFLPLICIGVAPFLALAVLRGAFFSGGVFHRTPKYGAGRGGMKGARAMKFALVAFGLFGVTFWPVAALEQISWLFFPLAASIPAGFFFTGALLVREGGVKRQVAAIFSSFFSPH